MKTALLLGSFVAATGAGVLLAKGIERLLDYWSRRISIGTLYLQWADDR